jgi:hypothetical protein
VKRISEFLAIESSPQLIEEIMEKCQFKAMAEHKNSNIPQSMGDITPFKNDHIFYRKGIM